jgi:hypothetical protein
MGPSALLALAGCLALGAAAGLNPWIPLLGIGLAARTDVVALSAQFEWLGTNQVLAVLAVLFVVDLVGDKVVVVDHLLHVVGLVVAPVSGGIVASAQAELSGSVPLWLTATVGAGLALGFQGGRSALRPAVSAVSGGAGNPVVSVLEDVASFSLVVAAVVVPVLAALGVVVVSAGVVVLVVRRRARVAPSG